MEEEKLNKEAGYVQQLLGVGSGACKKQDLAASWGTGPNHLQQYSLHQLTLAMESGCLGQFCNVETKKETNKQKDAKHFLLITASISKTFEIRVHISIELLLCS